MAVALLGGSAAMVSAASVTPTPTPINEGNPTCADFGSGWIELKIEGPGNGTFTDGALSVTISNFQNSESGNPGSFDWSSNIGVDAVVVKAGSDKHNLFMYNPESTGDTGLGPQAGEGNGLSHVSFCYDVDPATPTPSETPSPTPSESASPSPSESVSPSPTGSVLPIEDTTCAELGFDLAFEIIGDLSATTFTSSSANVTTNWTGQAITITNVSADGLTFDWSSTLPVSVVIVSGDAGAPVIVTFEPAVTAASGLTADAEATVITAVRFCAEAPEGTQPPAPTDDGQDLAAGGGGGGGVGGVTVTPPPTDTAPVEEAQAQAAWPIILLVITTIIVTASFLTPARRER